MLVGKMSVKDKTRIGDRGVFVALVKKRRGHQVGLAGAAKPGGEGRDTEIIIKKLYKNIRKKSFFYIL